MFLHRQFQKYSKRTGDEKEVSILLKEFQDADELLTKVRMIETEIEQLG